MTTRSLLLLWTVTVATPAISARDIAKPNIVFIMVDDLGKDWISCYGADNIETPHIDGLAKTGMKFDKVWSMPQCTPTRATLLTGQYPWRTGWVNHWDVPRWGVGYFDWKEYKTFANVLKGAGYSTAIAGKWQINDFRLEPKALEKHGFDDWCVWTGYETGNPASGKRYQNPYIHTREGSKTYAGRFGPDIYCDFLIDFMTRNKSEPMMLYFPMALTHGPLVPTPKEPNASGKFARHKAMVRYTDHLVGRIIKSLDDLKIRERTIVFFTTDNGTGKGVLGTRRGRKESGGKASNFEGGVCQPFIVNCPGTVAGGVSTNALTDFTDLLPTWAELAGAELPKATTIDGRSFAPLLLGRAEGSPRRWIMAMGHGAGIRDQKGVRSRVDFMDRVIRDQRYKAWINTDRVIDQLYDLDEDPGERKNLIDSSTPDVRKAIERFRAVIAAQPRVDARPRYRPRAANSWDKMVKRR